MVSCVLGCSLCRVRRRSPPTNPRNGGTGVYFTQPPRRNPIAQVLVPGSGMSKQQKRILKRPQTSLSTARPPGGSGVHRHTTTPPRHQRGGRHATGAVAAHRRDGMFRAAMYERDWRPSCIVRRSSSPSVVCCGQWCTHCDARDNHNHRRLVAIKTAFARSAQYWLTQRAITTRRRNR